jgi:hypothetical protein
MTRPLSPIERMIDTACGIAPGSRPPPAPRRTIVLECPTCGEAKMVFFADPIDPPAAVRATFPCGCGACRATEADEVHYFDAEGRELDIQTGDRIA